MRPSTIRPGGCGDEPEDRQRRHALAAARLPDDRQRFAGIDLERHAVDGAHDGRVGVEVGLQVVESEQRSGGQRHSRACPPVTRRGSSASRRPSPRKLKAMTVRKMAVPGTNSSHGKRRQRADAARLVQHVAPRRAGLLNADAEERQHDLAEDVAGNRERRRDDDVRHRVRAGRAGR